MFVGENFHDVAVFQFVGNRNDGSVHARGLVFEPKISVQVECKIERRATIRKFDDVSARCEHIDVINERHIFASTYFVSHGLLLQKHI